MAQPVKQATETEAEIKRAVMIRPEAIQDEYAQLPATLSRWIFQHVAAAKAYRLAELDLEVAEAKIKASARRENDEEIAAAGKDSKVKRLTDDAVDALVTIDPIYYAAREAVIDAAEVKERARGMVDAIQAKKDMLVSLGADIRSEREGDPSIRDRSRR